MKKFLKHISFLTIADFSSRIFGFFVTVFLTRNFSVSDFGLIQIGFAILSFGLAGINPGIQIYGARKISLEKIDESEFISNIFFLRLFLSTIFILISIIISKVFYTENIFFVFLFLLSLFPNAISLEWYFQAKEKISLISKSRSVMQIIFSILCFVLVYFFRDINFVAVSLLIANLVSAFILLFGLDFSIKKILSNWKINEWKSILKNSLPIGFGNWIAQIGISFPPIAIVFFSSSKEVGIFSAANKIVFFALMIDRIFFFLFYPIILQSENKSRENLKETINIALKVIFAILLPLCVFCFLFSNDLIFFVYGTSYFDAINVLKILIWFVFATTFNSIFIFGLISIGKEKIYSLTIFLGTIFQICLIAVGSYFSNSIGASIGIVVGEFLIMVLMVLQFKKFVFGINLNFFWKPIIAAITMFAIYFFEINIFLEMILSVLIFAVIFLLFKGISKNDLDVLKNIL